MFPVVLTVGTGGKQGAKRYQQGAIYCIKMLFVYLAEGDCVPVDKKGTKNFGQTFIEPQRDIFSKPDMRQIVPVFVKYYILGSDEHARGLH